MDGPHIPSSPFLWSAAPVVSVLLLVLLWWERRATEEPVRVWAAVLWSVSALAAFTGGWALSRLIQFGRNELRSGEALALMPDAVAVVVASGSQFLCASCMLAGAVGNASLRRYGALLAAALVFAGAGVMGGSMTSSPVQHAAFTGGRPVSDPPTQVAGDVQELDTPEGNVLSVHPIPSGVLWGLEDGAMAVDPLTGEELWRYRFLHDPSPEPPVSIEVVPGLEAVVIEATRPSDQDPSEYSTSRVTVDAASGEVLHRVEDGESVLGEGVPSRGTDMSPVEGEGVVFAGEGSGQLSVFGSSSGAHLWSSEGAAECSGDPSNAEVVEGAEATATHVFATFRCPSDGTAASEPLRSVVHAFAADTGEVAWTHEIDDADHPTGGDFTVSSDGSLLYRYEQTVGTYTVLDTATGDEVAAGQWDDPRPAGGIWENVIGDGVLLGEGPAVTLTDAHGEPAHTVDLGTAELEEPFVATEEALHLLERPEGAGPVALWVRPWDGSDAYPVENVLGRDLTADESVDMQPVPGGIVVYAEEAGRVTSAFMVS